MEPIYIAALSCFFMSAFGYVIYQFWMRPVLKYRWLKKDASVNIASSGLSPKTELKHW